MVVKIETVLEWDGSQGRVRLYSRESGMVVKGEWDSSQGRVGW